MNIGWTGDWTAPTDVIWSWTTTGDTTNPTGAYVPDKMDRLERLEAERWARRRGRLLALELDCRIKEGNV